LTEIKEPEEEPNAELEAANAKIAELEAQLATQNAFRKNAEKQINEMTAQIAEFKNLVKTTGAENDVPAPPANPPTNKGFKYKKNV
jgi:septal ring factor EnvC (AmiA/AmiB activator)